MLGVWGGGEAEGWECEENPSSQLHSNLGTVMEPSLYSHQVFISVDDLEPPGTQDPEDSKPKQEREPGAGTPGTAAAEQQSVEFDSPDSGLPSSRNYSVASGIQSSLDEAQSVGFEEDGAGEEGSEEPATAAHTFLGPHDPGQEKLAPASELEAGEELTAVCAAAYTVRGCSLILLSVAL